MAVKKVYVDLDGGFVNTLLNWRITNLTTIQRNQLSTQLGVDNIGLTVFDTTANSLFVWGGSTWLPVGGGSTPTVPGGDNGDVQFNNHAAFDGSDQFVWNALTNNLLIGTSTDNETARLQILDGTGESQLALHFDDNNYAEFLIDNIGDLTISSIGSGGGILLNSYLFCNEGIYIAEGNFLAWGTPSSFTTNLGTFADGSLTLLDSTQGSFSFLQFGGVTSSHPAIHVNTTTLEIKLADNSAYSNLALSKLLLQSSSLGAVVNGTLETDNTNLYFTLGGIRKEVSFGTFDFELSTTGTTGAATYIGTQLNIPIYQGELTLTTTGSTGVSTLIGNVLNIPDYAAPSGYTLPPATYTSLGGVIVGSNLSVNNTGLLNLFASGVTGALGYTPYNSTNPSNYISLTALSAVLPLSYNNTTGVFTIANATTSSYGVVEVGANIGVSNGIISLQSSGITGALGYTPLDPSGTSAQYFAGNGQLFTFPTLPTPGGSNTDIQYNNSGAFGGTNAFTWSGLLLYVSGNTQITSLGSTGTTMVVASSTGLLSTQSLPTTTSPGGSNTDIQFNSLGSFSGSNNLTWNGSLLFVSGNTQIGSLASTGTTMVVATSTGLLQTQTIPVSAISSVSNSDGSLIISPTTGAVVASLNPAHSNIWTAAQTFQDNGLGATTANFISLVNNTAATSGVTQVSPALLMTGQGWKTTSPAGSSAVSFQQYVQPVNGTTAPTGNWILSQSISGATEVAVLTVNSAGTMILTSAGTPSLTFSAAGETFLVEAVAGTGMRYGNTNSGGGFLHQFYGGGTIGSNVVLQVGPTNSFFSSTLAVGATAINNKTSLGTAAGTTALSSFNIPTGVAPTAPVEGDMWKTGTHLFIYLNGTTVQIV